MPKTDTTPPSPHAQILNDITNHLSVETHFPTCMEAALLILNTLKDGNASLDRIVSVINTEPQIYTKLLRLANSVIYNPRSEDIDDMSTAVARLGYNEVRNTSLAIAITQMAHSRNARSIFPDVGRLAWEHALHVATIARSLARLNLEIRPEEAMLLGMIQDIGIFYLLFRAAEYPYYGDNRDATLDLLRNHHRGIGQRLQYILGLPRQLILVAARQQRPQDIETLSSLNDCLYIAHLLADEVAPGLVPLTPEEKQDIPACHEYFGGLVSEAHKDVSAFKLILNAP
ncbi:MAG: HDOD domain-containing protein [Azonexus sp.]|jgi:HD-like signal output (HDOD) protein|nr:HDOD domain-containing protein [Azonexus sp.]